MRIFLTSFLPFFTASVAPIYEPIMFAIVAGMAISYNIFPVTI